VEKNLEPQMLKKKNLEKPKNLKFTATSEDECPEPKRQSVKLISSSGRIRDSEAKTKSTYDSASTDSSPERRRINQDGEKQNTASKLDSSESEAEDEENRQCFTSHPTQKKSEKKKTESGNQRPTTRPKHFMKPPKFNGTTTFETYYAQFENCAEYNRWSCSEQLAHLKAALTEDAGQLLSDCPTEMTNSLNKFVKLLQERFGGAAQSDKYRMEL